MEVEPGYERLAEVLQQALDQAQKGKGKERHACGEPFEHQEICQGARKCGVGAMIYQARKKSLESLRLNELFGADEAVPDLLGAIIYQAAAVIVMEEQAEQHPFKSEGSRLWRDCDERTAARNVEDTVRWRQSKDEYLKTVSEILNTPPRPEMEAHPSLADLVDWSDAPDWAVAAIQNQNGWIFWLGKHEEDEIRYSKTMQKWLVAHYVMYNEYKKSELAQDWQTPLKRPWESKAPSDSPWR